MRKINFAFITMIFLFTGSVALTAETPMKVSLCDVAKNPEQYYGKLISIAAQYNSDGFENDDITVPACKETGLGLSMHNVKGVESLLAALNYGMPGTLDKLITATFIGVFHYDPEESPHGMLTVQEVQDVTAKPTPEVKTEPCLPITIGEQVENLRARFGNPSVKNDSLWKWDINGNFLSVIIDASTKVKSYCYTWGPGHPYLLTPDGVILGKDTLASVRRKLSSRIIAEKHDSGMIDDDFGMVDGVWFLVVQIRPQPGRLDTISYNWYLNDGIPSEAAIIAKGGSDPSPEIFKDVVVAQYAISAQTSKTTTSPEVE